MSDEELETSSVVANNAMNRERGLAGVGMLASAVSWLAPGGLFAAHLDLGNIRVDNGSGTALLRRLLAVQGIDYNPRRRLVTCHGPAQFDFPFRCLGADDRAGPNFTGQAAVDSIYETQ